MFVVGVCRRKTEVQQRQQHSVGSKDARSDDAHDMDGKCMYISMHSHISASVASPQICSSTHPPTQPTHPPPRVGRPSPSQMLCMDAPTQHQSAAAGCSMCVLQTSLRSPLLRPQTVVGCRSLSPPRAAAATATQSVQPSGTPRWARERASVYKAKRQAQGSSQAAKEDSSGR